MHTQSSQWNNRYYRYNSISATSLLKPLEDFLADIHLVRTRGTLPGCIPKGGIIHPYMPEQIPSWNTNSCNRYCTHSGQP